MEAPFAPPILCPVLIGRVHDLTTLHLLVDRAKSGQGQVALVCGEAGIGKSRLVAETKVYAAAQGFLLLQGNCFRADLSCPYAPLLDLLRSSASKQLAASVASDLAPFARALHHFLPDVVPLPPELASRSSPDPEYEKHRLFTALTQFFTGQASRQPVLLIMEDIHWSDDISLEFLHYLARRCSRIGQEVPQASRPQGIPLQVLLTYRSDEVRPRLRHFLAQLQRERLAREILLAPLTRSDVDAMGHAILALPCSARFELLDPLYALTEGNPFFVEELLESPITAGNIFYENGRWECKSLSEFHIPRSVQDAVQQRTARLSEGARRVLILAAVAGRHFDFALLQQLTHDDEDQLLQVIRELIAAQLVIEESAERFAFRHALTRQAVYADLLVRERRALHRSIAETMERFYAPAFEAHLADLAYHFSEAQAWQQALEYGQRAGEKAQALHAPRAAIERLTRALDAAHHLGRVVSPQLYQARGQAYETIGAFEPARSDYEKALDAARCVHDQNGEWQSLIALGFLWAARDYAQTRSYYQQALELARSIGDPLTLAHSLNRLGNWQVNIAQPLEGLRCHQEALAIFQGLNDQHGKASTLDLLGLASNLSGDPLGGITYYQQAVALFQQLDDRKGLVSCLASLTGAAMGRLYYGFETLIPVITSFAEVLPYGELALKIAREIGQRSVEAYVLVSLAACWGAQGEYAQALELAQVGLQIAEEIEHRQWLLLGHLVLGALYLDLLCLSEARQRLEQALTLAHEIGSEHWTIRIAGALTLVCIAQQDLTRAEALFDAALGPDAPPRTVGQRMAWYARAELALARNNPVLALNSTDQLMTSTANLSTGGVIPRLSKLRGEVLVALQRGAEAESELCAAQEAARRQGARPLLWRIGVAPGKLYQTQGRKAQATQAFSNARALIEELAASVPDEHLREQFLSQATAMLPQKRSLTPSRAARQAYGGLTNREREVARLIAQGKSNRELADLLVVGNRTVEAHVSSILSKLGVTSRAQIAVWAHEKGLVHTSE